MGCHCSSGGRMEITLIAVYEDDRLIGYYADKKKGRFTNRIVQATIYEKRIEGERVALETENKWRMNGSNKRLRAETFERRNHGISS